MSEKCELCDYFSSTLENDHGMSLIGVKLLIVLRFFGQIVFRRLNLCRIWAYSFYIYLYSFYLYIFVQNAANVVLPTLSVLFLELENLVLSLMFFFFNSDIGLAYDWEDIDFDVFFETAFSTFG